jgi:hypothetical protein
MRKKGLKSGFDYKINAQYLEVDMPEVDLIVAVVNRAKRDLEESNEREKKSALQWFNSEEDHAMSFKWCCEALNMSRESVLKTLSNQGGEGAEELQRSNNKVSKK